MVPNAPAYLEGPPRSPEGESIRYAKPCLEGCEERVAPATLVWNSAAAGNFSTAGNWNPQRKPNNGDTLQFNGTPTGTATDDMAGLSLAGLTINNTRQTVQLNNALTVTGDVSLGGGKLTGPSSLTMNAPGTVELFGGTLDTRFQMGGIGVKPSVSISGGAPGNFFTITQKGTLDNFGNATLGGVGDHIINQGSIVNESDATFDIQADVNILGANSPGSVGNKGTFKKSGGSASSIETLAAFTNSGALILQSGTLTLTHGMVQDLMPSASTQLNGGNLAAFDGLVGYDINLNRGTLTGSGQITCRNLNNNGATVSPGYTGSPSPVTVLGNYVQGSNGTLNIAISSMGLYSAILVQKNPNDNLNATGSATLAGTLNVNKDANYKPPYGQTLGIVRGEVSVGGGFSIVSISNNQWYNGDTALYFIPLLNSNGKEFDLFATYYG